MKQFAGYEKGVDLGGWLSQCSEYTAEHYKTFIGESDFAVIAGWGADHVRLPVDWQVFQREDASLIEDGFGYVENAIAWARKNGLRMILDLHKTMGYSFDDDPDRNCLFADEKLQGHFYALWEEFAKRFSQYEDMLAFELLNEVTSPSYNDSWNRIAGRAVQLIRNYSPTIKILIGGYWNNSIDALKDLDPPADANIVYNFHCYTPLLFTHQGAPWVPGMPHDFHLPYPCTFKAHNDAARKHGQTDYITPVADETKQYDKDFFVRSWQEGMKVCEERGVPLYCGEYGVIDRASLRHALAWFRDIHAAFVECGIGHAAWSYKQMDFGLSDERMKGVIARLITLL
ncbi:MAG: cellulase family glycosylhydrolase [Treponema sp.]|nr:cellulase family glycosylhydrolase [Treponema sp.]